MQIVFSSLSQFKIVAQGYFDKSKFVFIYNEVCIYFEIVETLSYINGNKPIK